MKLNMEHMNRAEQVEYLKALLPVGTRLMLKKMPNDPNPIPEGTTGTVTGIDGLGTIRMQWDNGRALALVPNVDEFEKI